MTNRIEQLEQPEQLEQQNRTYVPVLSIDQLPERIGRRVHIGSEEVAVFRLSDGRIAALENKSPHRKGGVLCEGIVSGDYLFDPLYDWKISLIDGKVQAPDTGQVKTYPVRVENGQILIGV